MGSKGLTYQEAQGDTYREWGDIQLAVDYDVLMMMITTITMRMVMVVMAMMVMMLEDHQHRGEARCQEGHIGQLTWIFISHFPLGLLLGLGQRGQRFNSNGFLFPISYFLLASSCGSCCSEDEDEFLVPDRGMLKEAWMMLKKHYNLVAHTFQPSKEEQNW